MRLSLLVTVMLRMFAFSWLVDALFSFSRTFAFPVPLYGTSSEFMANLARFVAPGAYLLMATVAWIYAAGIARKIVAEPDPEIRVAGFGVENAYALGFLAVGLWLCLSHLGSLVNWLHYLVVEKAGDDLLTGQHGVSIYDFSLSAVPCVAGGAIALMAPHLGRKMAAASAKRPPNP